MDDRYLPYGPRNEFFEDGRPDSGSRDYTYSSARDYAAAREGRGNRDRSRFRSQQFGDHGYGGDGPYGERGYYRNPPVREYGADNYDSGRRFGPGYNRDDERGFFERAGDEVRSWFGDEEAERRREADARRQARDDEHYREFRGKHLADIDRDYDEYRRENAQKFHNEFTSWRTERQGQRSSLSRVAEHMDVFGSDGSHVGTVDKVRGDRIILTKSDTDAGGHHHSIPSRWITSVDSKVTLSKTADEAQSHWRDEERSGALGWDSDVQSSSTAPKRTFNY